MAASSLDAFLWAIGQQESGGNYKSVNSVSGALGKYQVMPANVASWTKRALGKALTPQQYLASPSAQDAVAKTILGGYYQKYGAAGAAAMWYSGQSDPNKTYGNPPVRTYVNEVLARMGKAPAGGGTSSSSSGGTADATPASDSGGLPSDCLWGFDLPVVGTWCILTKGQGRAILGAVLLGAGGIVTAGGLIILASYGLKSSGALEGVANAAKVLPGAGGLASRAVSASDALKRRPAPHQKKQKQDQEQGDGGTDGG